MNRNHPEEQEIGSEQETRESMEVIIKEIHEATRKIEDMVGKTDIVPEHLEIVLKEARKVSEKYEFTDGDEDFDVSLDILVDTIKNTELLEEDVARRFSNKVGEAE
jgi:hypothetical protein